MWTLSPEKPGREGRGAADQGWSCEDLPWWWSAPAPFTALQQPQCPASTTRPMIRGPQGMATSGLVHGCPLFPQLSSELFLLLPPWESAQRSPPWGPLPSSSSALFFSSLSGIRSSIGLLPASPTRTRAGIIVLCSRWTPCPPDGRLKVNAGGAIEGARGAGELAGLGMSDGGWGEGWGGRP